jgi:hypothetical protein
MSKLPVVELLYVEGCPNQEPALALVERVAAELRVAPRIEVVEVADAGAAVALRFLGSPTVRIDGHDVEPGADERREFALSCRVYQTGSGLTGRPDEAWIREALTEIGR